MAVQILRTWVVALMALLCLPTSGYCLLEKANLVPAFDCCVETASHRQQSQTHQTACEWGCCPIEYAVYSGLDSGVVDSTPPSDLLFAAVVSLMERPAEVSFVCRDQPPTGLPRSWQFIFRTALPVRAPSVAA